MTKRELDLLENIFAKEITGGVYKTKSKLAKKLEEDGFIVEKTLCFGKDCLGLIKVKGFVLTHLGNITYCMSDRCK